MSALEEAMPVVTTKPKRGQEIISTPVADELYHEGYIDGKKYLVPDRNLEAMKDIINLKMRQRKSTRYKHQTSHELADYDHFKQKLNKLIEKLDNISNITLDEITATNNTTNTTAEESESSGTSSTETESSLTSEEGEVEQIYRKPLMAEPEPESSEEEEEEDDEEEDSYRESEQEECTLRFLISGHFKNDETPMYIVQEYEGQSNVFKDLKADFTSEKKEGNVDITVSGKFYSENILEESKGKPVFLNIKPTKIYIDPDNCRIFYNCFEETFVMKTADVSIKGEFVTCEKTNKITPLISFKVKENKHIGMLRNNEDFRTTEEHITTILLTDPKWNNPFYEEPNKTKNRECLFTKNNQESKTAYSKINCIPDNPNCLKNKNHKLLTGVFIPFHEKTVYKLVFVKKRNKENEDIKSRKDCIRIVKMFKNKHN